MSAATLGERAAPVAGGDAASPSGMIGDAGFAMGAKLLYLVTRLGLPPLVLAHVSLSEYGLWAACFVIIGYIGLADMGLASVYVRYVARMHAQGDTGGISRILSTGMFGMGAIACALFALLLLFLPLVLDLLNIGPEWRRVASILIPGTAFVFLADMTLGGFAYLLHGMQRIRLEQQIWVAAYLFEMVLIVAFLQAGMGVLALLAAFALRYAFSLALTMRQAFRLLPALRVTPRLFDRATLRETLGFGLRVQSSTMFAMVLHSADRLVAGMALGPKAIALFDLGGKIPVAATSVPGAISHVTLPAAARIDARTDAQASEQLADLCLQSSRAVSLVSAIPMAFLAAFSVPLCRAWLGDRADLAVLPLIMALSAIGAHLHIVTGPASAVFRGQGNVGNEFVYHGLRVLGMALGIGAAVAALGMSVPALACGLAAGAAGAALLYLLHAFRALGIPVARLVTRVLLPGGLPAIAAAAMAAAWLGIAPATLSRWPSLALLAAFGLAYTAICVVALWRVLDAAERNQIETLARRLLRLPA